MGNHSHHNHNHNHSHSHSHGNHSHSHGDLGSKEKQDSSSSSSSLSSSYGHQLQVISSISFYMITSITMVMANKWILNDHHYPFTFLWLQVLVAVALLHLTSALGILKAPRINWEVSKALTSMIAVNVIGLSLNTLCLQYVDASFYQVARSLILPFTVLIMYIHMKKPSSPKIILSCGIVCIGFLAGVWGEIQLSWLGVFFGVFSSLTTALHAVLIKGSLEVVNQNTMDLVFYNNVLTAVFLFPLVLLSGEISPFFANVVYAEDTSSRMQFLFGLLLTGIFGYLINLAGFLQIKMTSPLSHMVSSAVRGVLQTVIAVWLFGDQISSAKALGITLILLGSSCYTYLKSLEFGGGGGH